MLVSPALLLHEMTVPKPPSSAPMNVVCCARLPLPRSFMVLLPVPKSNVASLLPKVNVLALLISNRRFPPPLKTTVPLKLAHTFEFQAPLPPVVNVFVDTPGDPSIMFNVPSPRKKPFKFPAFAAVQKYHTETHKKIDKLGRKLLKDSYAKYENTPEISSWDQMIKMLIDQYWDSSERLIEQELIDTFEQES